MATWNALNQQWYNMLICNNFTSYMIKCLHREISMYYCNQKFWEKQSQTGQWGPILHLLVKLSVYHQMFINAKNCHLWVTSIHHCICLPTCNWYSFTEPKGKTAKVHFHKSPGHKSLSLTTVVIICSWHIFCRKTISCVANNKWCFADSTISNKHTLDIRIISWAVLAALHWRLPQSAWI